LLWPLAAFGLQAVVRLLINRETAVSAVGALALILPAAQTARLYPSIQALSQPGDAPGLRALYGNLPAGSALVADNYFTARILNYLHFSNAHDPDPNPRLLANDAGQVREAAADGQQVFALEAARAIGPPISAPSLGWLAATLPKSSGVTAAFSPTESLGAQAPPAAFVYRGERPCTVLRLGQRTDASTVLADGGWLATLEGSGKASITLEGASPVQSWRHGVWNGRGEAAIDAGKPRVLIDSVAGTRAVFSLSMARPLSASFATIESGDATAARVCQVAIPEWPSTGALNVGPAADPRFGEGWHSAERGGTQRFRWAARTSVLRWRMARPSEMRLLLRVRPASAAGATLRASINGGEVGSCALPAGEWTDCRLTAPAANMRDGLNELVLSSDTIAPADRPGDPRELAFVMQAGRVRIGR